MSCWCKGIILGSCNNCQALLKWKRLGIEAKILLLSYARLLNQKSEKAIDFELRLAKLDLSIADIPEIELQKVWA